MFLLDVEIPTEETMLFFEGLLRIIDKYDDTVSNLPFMLIESLEENSISEIKNRISSFARSYSEQDPTISFFQELKSTEYENMFTHRWIAIFILNILDNSYQLNRQKFFRLLKLSANFIPLHMQRIENLDLSKSKIVGDELGSKSNLSKANLQHSTLTGNFNGTKFIGDKLLGATIEYKAQFNGVDFSGADLKELKTRYSQGFQEESDFIAKFVDCRFFETKFNNANIGDCTFYASNFRDSDFSGASLNSNFVVCSLSYVTTNEKTLLSKMTFEKDWEKAHTTPTQEDKERIRLLIDDLDEGLKRNFLRDNPEI